MTTSESRRPGLHRGGAAVPARRQQEDADAQCNFGVVYQDGDGCRTTSLSPGHLANLGYCLKRYSSSAHRNAAAGFDSHADDGALAYSLLLDGRRWRWAFLAAYVAAYHHRSITVVSPQHHSGAVLSVPARQNLFKYKNNSAVKISLSTKNIAVMQS